MNIEKVRYCYALANDLETRGEVASARFVRRLLQERRELIVALECLSDLCWDGKLHSDSDWLTAQKKVRAILETAEIADTSG